MTEDHEVMQRTAFGKACYDLTHSERVMDDLTFGRRVGLYELRGEIGSGNFSQVRFGIHDLTKGEIRTTVPLQPSFSSCRQNKLTTGTKNLCCMMCGGHSHIAQSVIDKSGSCQFANRTVKGFQIDTPLMSHFLIYIPVTVYGTL